MARISFVQRWNAVFKWLCRYAGVGAWSISAFLLVKGTLRRWYYWVYAFALDPFELYAKHIRSLLPKSLRVEGEMPSDWFPFALGIGLSIAAAATYHDLRKEKIKTDRLLENREQRQNAVNQLEELRLEAISDLLNRGISNDSEVDQLAIDQEAWRQRVSVVLRENFTRATFLRFDGLGRVPGTAYGHTFNGKHQTQLNLLTVRLDRIMEITGKFIG